MLFISNPLNANSNFFASPHFDFPVWFMSNSFNSNSNFIASPHLNFQIFLISNPLNSNLNFIAFFFFIPSLVRIRPVVWEENGDKQTNRQTDTPFCFIYIDCIEKGGEISRISRHLQLPVALRGPPLD